MLVPEPLSLEQAGHELFAVDFLAAEGVIVVDSLGEPADLFGHSHGATVALGAAQSTTETAASIVARAFGTSAEEELLVLDGERAPLRVRAGLLVASLNPLQAVGPVSGPASNPP